MKHFLNSVFIAWVLTVTFTSFLVAQSTVKIGILIDGPWERNNEISAIVKKEILDLTSGEFSIEFPEDKSVVSEWKASAIRRNLERLLADADVDMILTMGVISSHEAANYGPLPKPVIAPFVIDPALQGLPSEKGGSGVQNLNYIAIPNTIERDVKAFYNIVEFTRLNVLVNKEVFRAIPQLQERTEQALGELPIQPKIFAVETLADALPALAGDVEAVYIAPLFQLSSADFDQLVQELKEKKLPSFSLMGRNEVERGIFAALNPNIFPRIARRTALNVQRILLGESPAEIPFAFTSGEELSINMATAREIRTFPDWGIITEAVLIDDEKKVVDVEWTLESAVHEGILTNQDVLTKAKEVSATAQNISLARANLLPQIDLSATGLQIDEDRAGLFQAEQSFSGSATLTQLIFSDGAWTQYGVQKSLQKSIEQEYEATRLDVALSLATAYLQVLSAKILEDIQKQNLKLSRSNLELSRVREAVGYAGRAEVYRWESQIASNRKAVIEANTLRNVAEIQLNRLLNRPQEQNFAVRETGLEEAGLLTEQGKLFDYMANPVHFKILRSFFVEEGLLHSPELQQLAAGIEAQERILRNTKRNFFLPTIAAQAQITRRFWEGGAGSEEMTLDPNDPLAPIFSSLGSSDDTDWNLALNLSFPLYQSGAKLATKKQALETLEHLRFQKKSIAEKIEQRIRSAGHTTGASYAAIKQSRDAANAGRKNLDLVIDAYSRGVLSITDLLEAQNASLISDQAAAQSIYDFLIELMALERAMGQMHVLRDAEARGAFFERLDQYFVKSGTK